MSYLERAERFAQELVALRRDFHRHPELSFQEHRTADVVAKHLGKLGIRVREGVGRTGVVGDLDNGPGPLVALRADMDALPIQEEADHEYCSTVPGIMHACGHDVHMTGLLGAARLLAEDHAAGRLPPGRIRFLFQPSEEAADEDGKSGATRMIEDGAMEGVQAVAGLHVGAHLPFGKIFVKAGPLMAGSDDLTIRVQGRSAHAALPHEGVDAVVLSAQGVLACQQVVSRNLSPMENGVVTFGQIEGGVAPNVVADRVTLKGTLRYFTEEVRERIQAGVQGAFKALEAMGSQVEVSVQPGYPPVVNDGTLAELVKKAAADVVGEEDVWPAEPMMGAEDFALLARQAPGVFVWLGAALPDPREHHHPRFDVDERILPIGAAFLGRTCVDLLTAG